MGCKTLKYSSQTTYIGRNGAGNQTGMGFTPNSESVMIEPLNSKGYLSHCMMNIPKKDIPEFIEILRSYL